MSAGYLIVAALVGALVGIGGVLYYIFATIIEQGGKM